MVLRLLREVELSIQIGYEILEHNPQADIEIHIDANSKKDQPTGKHADMLMGYAEGAGFGVRSSQMHGHLILLPTNIQNELQNRRAAHYWRILINRYSIGDLVKFCAEDMVKIKSRYYFGYIQCCPF